MLMLEDDCIKDWLHMHNYFLYFVAPVMLMEILM